VQTVPNQPAQRAIIFSPVLSDRIYQVETKQGITESEWLPLTNYSIPIVGPPQRTVVDLFAATPEKLYRVEISKP
jgi:hypothetical protein